MNPNNPATNDPATNKSATSRPAVRIRATALVGLLAISGPILGCRTVGIDAAAESASSSRSALTADADRLPLPLSMYCQHVAGHENPALSASNGSELRVEWDARRQFEAAARLTAVGDVKDQWEIVDDFTRNTQTPVLEAHQYDPSALIAEPPAVVAARTAIVAFDRDVCGA